MTKNLSNKTVTDQLYSTKLTKEAIIVPGVASLSYGDLLDQVNSLKNELLGRGISKTDRIAIVLPNSIEFVVTFLAVSAIATVAPLNPLYKAREFDFYIRDHL